MAAPDHGGEADRGPLATTLAGDPAGVATHLLGARLVSDLGERVSVRITEVEAYAGVGEDPGSHAHRRRTARNATMFGPVGHAYVYFTYGMHWCLNIVAHRPFGAGAILIRAGEVLEGIQTARSRRPAARRDVDLGRGPARLAATLGVSGDHDGIDLLDPRAVLRLVPSSDPPPPALVQSGPRTGVAGAGAGTPWRFWLAGDPTVSPYRRAAP